MNCSLTTKAPKFTISIKYFICNLFYVNLLMLFPSSEARIGQDEAMFYNNTVEPNDISNLTSSNDPPIPSEIQLIDTLDSNIVGGYPVNSPEKYPYMISIMEIDYWSGKARHSCAGTLIAPDVVLTAAHCVEYSANRIVDAGRFSWDDDYNLESFRVTGVYMHPDFNKKFFSHDVALLKLDGKASSQFAKLKRDENIMNTGDVIDIAGWGLTSEYGKPSPKLKEAQVKILSRGECQYFYGQYFSETMMCAYGNGQDACQGDSGGPALRADSNGVTHQVGIVSWGDGCGENPGVYTNLENPSIVDFINTYMCEKLSPESCIDDVFYGIDETLDDDENIFIESDDSTDDISGGGTYDKCKNIDYSSCFMVALTPWLGCYFSYQDCPEICCPNSCDPSVGCV